MVFPIVMYGCWELVLKEGLAPKNWCFWIVVSEKTLESPLNWSRSNQSVLRKSTLNIHWGTDAEVEAPMLWPPDAKRWLIGKDLMLGKIEGKRRREQQSITNSMDMNFSQFEMEQDRGAWHSKSWTRLSDWETTPLKYFTLYYIVYTYV